jgi:hypothetical protein
VVFQQRAGRAFQGLYDANRGNDLQDYKRRIGLMKQHNKTCTIDVNWLFVR